MNRDTLLKAAYAVHNLLGESDMLTRLSTRPKVVLEFPDIGAMYRFHVLMKRAFDRDLLMINAEPEARSGEGVVEMEVGGVTFVLICNQRHMTHSGKDVGYNSIEFISEEEHKRRLRQGWRPPE